MKKLTHKPCRICGEPVVPTKRKDRQAFYYPRQCPKCYKVSRDEPLRRKRISSFMSNSHPRLKELFSKRIHNSGSKQYIQIKVAEPDEWMYEHRHVMTQRIGRPLLNTELVHHIDGDTFNNSIDNLLLLNTAEHNKTHFTISKWSKNFDCCTSCGTDKRKHLGFGLCSACYQRKNRKP